MPYTDSSVDNLIFNVMDSAQYQSLVNAGTVEENELYLITDDLDPVIQTTTNLVTSISSSSTDTQYPSAKAVYDALPTATSDLTNDSGFITLSDVPTEVLNTGFIPSETPITSWVSGNWQISVQGESGTDSPATIILETITTENHVEYSGHKFPVSIPAVGAGMGKMFQVDGSGYVGRGVQLKDSANNNLLAIYSTDQYPYQSISSSVMANTVAINILVTGDTNNTASVGTRLYVGPIFIANSSTGDYLWTFTYDDAVEATDGSSSVPFTDLKQALDDGKVLQLYDDNGVCYPYISETSSTITFGKISNSGIDKYIVDNTDTVTITTDVLKATPSIYNITLPASAWAISQTNGYIQTVTVTGISSLDYPLVQPDITTEAQKTAWGYVVKGEAVTNGIEFTALGTRPAVDLSAVVMVF